MISRSYIRTCILTANATCPLYRHAAGAATIVIQNNDAPGVGFNDRRR